MTVSRQPEAETDVAELLAGRQAMKSNDGKRRRSPGVKPFMIAVILAAVIVGGSLSWMALNRNRAAANAPQKPEEMIASTLPPLTPYVPAPEPVVPPNATQLAAVVPASGTPRISANDKADDLQMQRRFSGGFTGRGGDTGTTGTGYTSSVGPDAADKGPLLSQLAPLKLRPSRAAMLADRNYLLTRGAMIDCGQQTKLVTDQPGMVTCYTTSDTYSANGQVVLVDAGSKIVGSYEHGVMQGQNRVFVAWQRIETPKGVIIDLDSPGTDQLGAAGEPGEVDTHFWDRFGGAIMLSVISDAGDAGVQAVANQSNSNITLNNTTGSANQMSGEALRNTINIPPTLYKDAGDRVSIYIARDMDFSGVYDLKPE